MGYFLDTIKSKSYWQFVLFSREGIRSIFASFGGLYLILETSHFFGVYTRNEYSPWAFLILIVLSIFVAIITKPPTKKISVALPEGDAVIEVRLTDIFSVSGAVMVSTNTNFEANMANGRIAPDSLQGQFTSRYFPGNEGELIRVINDKIDKWETTPPLPIGTTLPITTHGKTFYLTAMAHLNEHGNAWTDSENVKKALDGLWEHVRDAGELQKLAVPVLGTGRGRLRKSRKRMIAIIADSFAKASEHGKITEKLIIVVRPEDAEKFEVNLYEIKDYLRHILQA